jgi:hypothetical protein
MKQITVRLNASVSHKMKPRIAITLIYLLSLMCSGCVIYFDRPEQVQLRGIVVWDDDGSAVRGAHVRMMSNRNYLPFPGMSRIAAGVVTADAEGRFEFVVKNRWPAEIYAYDSANVGFGSILVNREEAEKIVIRIKKRRG